MPGTTFLPKAGVLGTVIELSIAVLIMISIALNYGYMVEKYPVTGGEYTFANNAYGRNHAYFCGWFLSLSYLAIVPLNVTALGLVSRKLLGGLLEVGYCYTIAGYDIYLGEVALASFALVFLGIALVCAVLSGSIGFYMATSRLLFSMAREKALPNWFCKINEKPPKECNSFCNDHFTFRTLVWS